MNNPSYTAAADIAVSKFVKLNGVTDYHIIQCVADDVAIGVSHEGPMDYQAPSAGAVGPAIRAGRSARVYGMGETCQIIAGAAITAGDLLKPNADGNAIPAASTDEYSAEALQSVAVGELVDIQIKRGTAP